MRIILLVLLTLAVACANPEVPLTPAEVASMPSLIELDPQVSPNGEYIAMTVLVPSSRPEATPIPPYSEWTLSGMAWATPKIDVIRIKDGSTVAEFGNGNSVRAMTPSWAPTSNRIAFVSDEGGRAG